jgi:Spy/CpxP family protein refolding chaperone
MEMRNRSWSFVLVGVLAVAGACDKQPTSLGASAPTSALQEAPQGGGGGRAARMMRLRNPFAGLLTLRDTLGLSADQVSRLKQLQAELKAKNQPLLAQLRAATGRDGSVAQELKGLTPEQRRAWLRELREQRRAKLAAMSPEERDSLRAQRRAKLEELKPVLEQMRSNTKAAVEQARAVLTPEQRSQLQALRQERVARMKARAGAGGGRRSRGGTGSSH